MESEARDSRGRVSVYLCFIVSPDDDGVRLEEVIISGHSESKK